MNQMKTWECSLILAKCILFVYSSSLSQKVRFLNKWKWLKKTNKLCLYTFLSSHPTNNCRYSKVLLTTYVLKIYPHLNVCVCAISIDIFKYLFFAICVQKIQVLSRSYPWVAKVSWRKKWQPTPVFLCGPSQGQTSISDYSPWGHSESNTTGWLSTQNIKINHKKSDKTYIKICEMIKI